MSKIIRAEDAIETAKKQITEQLAFSDDEGFDEFLYGFLKLFTKVINDTPAVEDAGVVRCPKCKMTYDEKYLSDENFCYNCGNKIEGKH